MRNMGFFSIGIIHRADLEEMGFDVSNIDDRQMALLANYLGEYLQETGLFWKILRKYARKMGIPQRGGKGGKRNEASQAA